MRGSDDRAITAAIAQLPPTGGTIELQPGTYAVRTEIRLPSHVSLIGAGDVTLALPAPTTVTRAAAQGATTLEIAEDPGFAPATSPELLPPPGPDDSKPHTKVHRVKIARIEGHTIHLAKPLDAPVAQGARIGYCNNIIELRTGEHIKIAHLKFSGGRLPSLPMPGHANRCAIFAEGRYKYELGPTAPPVRHLAIDHCQFHDLYGRAIALYSVVDSSVRNCTAERIGDEGIDLDHFTHRCTVADNIVRDAVTGVTINDGSDNIVERNTLQNCDVGVTIWRWKLCQQPDLDRNNTIRDNTIASRGKTDISVRNQCPSNVIRNNRLRGQIHAEDPSTIVDGNSTQ